MKNVIHGRHAVAEALRAEASVAEVFIATNASGPEIDEIKELASRARIPYRFVHPEKVRKTAGVRDHQGIAAKIAPVRYRALDEVLESLGESAPALMVVLDGVTNPKNLGMIARSAAGAGAAAIVVTARGEAPVDDLAVRASAGTIFRVPVVRTAGLGPLVKKLKHCGFWVYGLEAGADRTIYEVEWGRRTALVVGGEHGGLRRTVRAGADELVAIPLAEGVESLNAAVAAGVALFEVRRRLDAGGGRTAGRA